MEALKIDKSTQPLRIDISMAALRINKSTTLLRIDISMAVSYPPR
jgi:hypothetical protein